MMKPIRIRRSVEQPASIVIFDMDGTLTRANLDFDLIRREMGLGPRPTILEAMVEMPPEERARAEAILERHEAQAAATCELQTGAAQTVRDVRSRGIPVVLMTRNSRKSVEVFQRRHGLAFDLIWTREDGPMKPSPEPVRLICRRFGLDAAGTWVVGDYHYDIICGAGAGATTVLLIADGRSRPDWADEADFVIVDLRELPVLMTLNRTGPSPACRDQWPASARDGSLVPDENSQKVPPP